MVSERFICESLPRTTDAKLQQYLTWPLQPSSELCTWFVSHNWMTLFRGWGNPPKKEGHLGVWQLWMKNIKVWHIALTWHSLSELFDLIFSSESTWQIETKRDMIWMFIEWFPTKTCVVVSKEGVSILYMEFNYVSPSNEGRHIVLVYFFFCFFSAKLVRTITCVFPDRSIIFGMWVHDHKAVCRIP